jgi:cytochrome c-type biogenesis protein CcmH/NrfG
MLFIDDLLLSPITGFKFILRTLQRVAEQEYTDDTPLKERLLELQLKLEEGQLSEQEYVAEEAVIIRQLRELQNRKRELAGLPPEEGPVSMASKHHS